MNEENEEVENNEKLPLGANKYKTNLSKFNKLVSLSHNERGSPLVNFCKFDNCKLKSIDECDFCYQHVGFFEQRNINKVKICEWANNETNKKCNQLVYADFQHDAQDTVAAEKFCIKHAALLKQNTALVASKTDNTNKPVLVIDSTFETVPNKKHMDLNPTRVLGSMGEDFATKNYDLNELKFHRESDPDFRSAFKRKLASRPHANHAKKTEQATDDETATPTTSDEETDNTANELINTQQFYNNIDLENDLELLDPADSLDRTMLKLIAKNRATTGQETDTAVSSNGDIDYDYDMALSNSNVCTKEEAVKILKCKMSKLQFLYKKQMVILNDKMLYERKKYLVMKQAEAEQNKSQPPLSAEDKKRVDKDDLDLLRAGRKYKPCDKMELLIKQKYDPRHFKSECSIFNNISNQKSSQDAPPSAGIPTTPQDQSVSSTIKLKSTRSVTTNPALVANRCAYMSATLASGVTASKRTNKHQVSVNSAKNSEATVDSPCNRKPLPSSKYCIDHILLDKNQILFCPCSVEIKSPDSEAVTSQHPVSLTCRTPIIASIAPSCPLHLASRLADDVLSPDDLAQLTMFNPSMVNEELASVRSNTPQMPPVHLRRVYESVKTAFEKEAAASHSERPFTFQPASDVNKQTADYTESISGINQTQNATGELFVDPLQVSNRFGSLVRVKEEFIQNEEERENEPFTLNTGETLSNAGFYLDTPSLVLPEIKQEKVVPCQEDADSQVAVNDHNNELPKALVDSYDSASSSSSVSSSSSASSSSSSDGSHTSGSESSSSSTTSGDGENDDKEYESDDSGSSSSSSASSSSSNSSNESSTSSTSSTRDQAGSKAAQRMGES